MQTVHYVYPEIETVQNVHYVYPKLETVQTIHYVYPEIETVQTIHYVYPEIEGQSLVLWTNETSHQYAYKPWMVFSILDEIVALYSAL